MCSIRPHESEPNEFLGDRQNWKSWPHPWDPPRFTGSRYGSIWSGGESSFLSNNNNISNRTLRVNTTICPRENAFFFFFSKALSGARSFMEGALFFLLCSTLFATEVPFSVFAAGEEGKESHPRVGQKALTSHPLFNPLISNEHTERMLHKKRSFGLVLPNERQIGPLTNTEERSKMDSGKKRNYFPQDVRGGS